MMSRYSIRQCSHRGTIPTSCSIQPQPIRIEQRIAPLVASSSSSSSSLRYTIRRSLVTSSSSTTTASAPVVGNIVPRRTHRPRPPGSGSSSNTNTTTTTHRIPKPTNTSSSSSSPGSSSNYRYQFVRVGIPLVLFSVLSAWVVSNAYGGKLKEMEVSQGKSSISLRQAAFEAEHDEMMERLSKIVKDDSFDNTKRIQRPEEVLEERRRERQKRNVWYRRWYRAVTGQTESSK